MEKQIPAGYKQTEVGVIPEGWEITTIGDFAPLQRGFDLPNRVRVNGNYPVVYSNGVVNFHNQFQVKGPGVVTGRSGTIGKVHYIEDDYWPHNTALWVKKFNNAKPKYVYYLYLMIGLDRFASGSGVPTLNRNDAHSFKVGVPESLLEQIAIANALSDVDALIAALEKLIHKKTSIKTAAMQQLLTGKKRLPPFDQLNTGYKQTELGEIPKDWEVDTLDNAVIFLDGMRRPVKSGDRERMRGNYRYYGASGIVDYVNDYLFDGEFILLGEDGENILSRNLPLAFKVTGQFWVNNHAHIMQSNSYFNIDYLTAFLESLDYSLLNSGTAQPKLNKQNCLNISVSKPSIKEQTAIANVLLDMDTELDALQQRLAKTQQLKQGMMQELLTGKTRLI